MATKCTCLVLQCRARPLFVFALVLLHACDDPKQPAAGGVFIADASPLSADGGGAYGGATLGGAVTGGGAPGGTSGGGTTSGPGGGLTGGGDAALPWLPDAGPISIGPFPRRNEAVNVAPNGPYMVDDYEGPPSSLFDSSVIYYPVNATPPFALLALCPGFTNVKEDLLWWGPVMASHGFAITLLSPTSSLDFPRERAQDLEAAIALLKAENVRGNSPLFGKLDTERAGLLGHSMGAGAILMLMARPLSDYRAAVAWEPWASSIDTAQIRAPTMILAGEFDLVASPNDMAWPFYMGIPVTVRKVYAEFAGLGHNTVNDLGSLADRALHARWTIAWMKLNLEDDERYKTVVQIGSQLSRLGRAPADYWEQP